MCNLRHISQLVPMPQCAESQFAVRFGEWLERAPPCHLSQQSIWMLPALSLVNKHASRNIARKIGVT